MGGIFGIIWPVLWRFLAVAAFVAAIWWSWDHFIKDPYIEEGVKQEHVNTLTAEAKAKVAEQANIDLAKDVLGLKDRVAQSNKAWQDLFDADAAALASKNRLLATLAVKEKSALAEVERLKKLTLEPAATPGEACAEAGSILDTLSVRRNSAVSPVDGVQ